jgi:SSS family transporter
MLTPDLLIICGYLVAMPVLGVLVKSRNMTGSAYFTGDGKVPWWTVMLSIVATETSTLTVISTPGLVFGGGFTFLQLALGYVLGRIVAAYFLLPRYFDGKLVSAYQFLGKRFGPLLSVIASLAFVITRLLAEGVRLFAGAIPIQVILSNYRIHVAYWQIVIVLTALTLIYTLVGGLTSVIWVDAAQLAFYLLGAMVSVSVLSTKVPADWFHVAAANGRFQVLDFHGNPLTHPYVFVTAVIGGAFFSMASHGSDQLIVQRLLSCKGLTDARKALIGSGILVFLQFSLFLLLGAMLWVHFGPAAKLKPDDVYPTFIVSELPVGVSGFLIAGILASTMGALGSALTALSSSVVVDLYREFGPKTIKLGRAWTLIWAVAFAIFASLFSSTSSPVIQQGLAITGYTYGALLGAFVLGLLVKRANQTDAIVAFLATIAILALVIGTTQLAFPWYTPLGVAVTLLVGGLSLALRRVVSARSPG